MTQEEYQITRLPQKRWRMLVEREFTQLSDDVQRQRAEAILMALHNQHIGITPALVVSLVKTFWSSKNARQVQAESPWSEICDCLVRALTPLDQLTDSYIQVERSRVIYLLSQSPIYTISRLVSPLIATVCSQIGYCYLFSHQDDSVVVNAKNYERYDSQLHEAIKRITQEHKREQNSSELFWQDIVLMLVNESTLNTPLPETDPPTAAIFYRLNELPEWADDQTLRRLHTLITPLRTRHRQEGGVRGIRVTRRLEDIHSIVLSELMNPKLLVADRLLNTGYLVFEREPKREKLRDMLLIGIMPDLVRRQNSKNLHQSQLSADFAKTCWFNFAAQLGLLLRQYNLWQSEFRWIEGDAWDRMRVESHILLEMKHKKRRSTDIILDNINQKHLQRHHFLQEMNWLPDYLDKRVRYHTLNGWNDLSSEPLVENKQLNDLTNWVRLARRQQDDNPKWQRLLAKHMPGQTAYAIPRKLDFDAFTFVHIMVFLPALYREEWGGGAQGGLNLATQLRRNDPHRHLSVVWTPPIIMPLADAGNQDGHNIQESEWAYSAPYHPDRNALRRQPQGHAEVADTLITTWLKEVMEEIKHG